MSHLPNEAYPSFDAARSPLSAGTTLLEASAGTGKTYTLTAIFLRLIATEGLEVRQILVSTFTEAATRELKERIRLRLLGAREAFAEGQSDDSVLSALLERHASDREACAERIGRALRDLDEAQISTIHGFCQRALREFALESGQPFDAELCKDVSALTAQVAQDFLRTTLDAVSPTLCGILGPPKAAELQELLQLRLNKPTLLLESAAPLIGLAEAVARTEEACLHAARLWEQHALAIRQCLLETGKWYDARGAANPAKMEPLLSALAAWFSAGNPAEEALAFQALGGLEPLQILTPARLEKCTLKSGVTPLHPFFDAVEALQGTLSNLHSAFYHAFLESAPLDFLKLKSERNLLGFDDLLRELQTALGARGAVALRERLRERYRAALLDEFQDTDPVQESIFEILFGGEPNPDPKRWLFLIGDPKQAIYSFRGADIHTYIAAGARAHHRYSLDTNHRSAESLVNAVNQLFQRHRHPFILSDIGFAPVGARGLSPLQTGGVDAPPFQIWLATPPKPLSAGAAKTQLFQSVAASVVETLGSARIDGKPLEPSQIAVLLSANSQGPEIQEALRQRGVPSVLFSDQSVFASPDARDLLALLRAVESPGRARVVRRALVTPFLGRTAADLVALQDDAAEWERQWNGFRSLLALWTRRGFVLMFNSLLQNWGVRNRLLARPDGERRLTNLLHLGELLATAARNCPVLPGPLLRWLEQQIGGDTDAEVEDSSKMRLESDEHAVQVLTMHASKGLEWEVVYCPFTWAGGTSRQYRRSKAVLPPEARGQRPALRVDALGKSPAAAAVLSQISPRIHREAAAEQTRLLYVAATRAKRLCYLAWGAIKDAESSGTAWLFHGLPVSPENWEQAERQLKQLQTPEQVGAAIGEVLQAGPAKIHVCAWPEQSPVSWKRHTDGVLTLSARVYTRPLDLGWGVHSFTSLSAGAEHAERDNDNVSGPVWVEALDGESIHAFPAGAGAGSCLHSIFENIEFTSPSEIEAEVSRRLLIAGFDAARWTGAVSATLRAVLEADLGEGLVLGRIPAQQRKVEAEFLLPMSELSSDELRAALGAEAAGRLYFDARQGWLKGFMDLVFEQDGRFYIVDWKSNRLGAQAAAYDAAGMHAAMVQHSYLLQASLYALALHRCLSTRIPGYAYETHFGGAFYIFVRGVCPRSPGTGVYHVRPSEAEILALEGLFQSVSHAC